jgi:hypothetical protein
VRVVDHGGAAAPGHGQRRGATDNQQPDAAAGESGQQRLGRGDELRLAPARGADRADHHVPAGAQLGHVRNLRRVAGTGVGSSGELTESGRVTHHCGDLVAARQSLGHNAASGLPGRAEDGDAHGSH